MNFWRHENRQFLNVEKEKLMILDKGINELEVLTEKLDKFKNNNFASSDRLKQIEELVEAETKNIKNLEEENTRLSGVVFRSEQQLFKLEEAEKCLKVIKTLPI